MRVSRMTVAAAMAVIAGLAAAGADACTLNLGWESYEPFQFKDADGKVTGLDVEIFQAIAKDAGCTVTVKEVPWKRLLGDMETGKMDAAMGAQSTPEREAFAVFSPAYRRDGMSLFVRKGELSKVGDAGITALPGKPFKVGTAASYEYGDTFDALKRDPVFAKQIDESASTELNLRKLASKRIDGFIENEFVAVAMARKENLADTIEAHPVPVQSADAMFMFSKKSVDAKTVTAFNEALTRAKADGRLAAIIAKYLK